MEKAVYFKRRIYMKIIRTFTVFIFIAASIMMISIQGVFADEKKPTPSLEVSAGSAAQMHNSEGIKQYILGNWEEAEKHFSEAVKADNKSAEAHYNHGLALDHLEKHKDAAEEFDQALKLAPNNPAIADSPILKRHLDQMNNN